MRIMVQGYKHINGAGVKKYFRNLLTPILSSATFLLMRPWKSITLDPSTENPFGVFFCPYLAMVANYWKEGGRFNFRVNTDSLF
jgi:hypothetical protein